MPFENNNNTLSLGAINFTCYKSSNNHTSQQLSLTVLTKTNYFLKLKKSAKQLQRIYNVYTEWHNKQLQRSSLAAVTRE